MPPEGPRPPRGVPDGRPAPHLRRSLVLDTSVRLLFHAVLVLSVYFLMAGHNRPGGGFVGGLVAGAGFALRYVAGGVDEVRAVARVRPWLLLGWGLVIAVVTGAVPLLAGSEFHDVGKATVELGPLGTLKVTSALPFDVGVYLVVVGLALMVFEGFGEEVAPAVEDAAEGRLGPGGGR